ncbi:MAG TPA: alpha/beta hydrolase [Dehalococcoidia bacterium]|nr:alpha/beta hydrolase [Dehalococcoidia bacterium]
MSVSKRNLRTRRVSLAVLLSVLAVAISGCGDAVLTTPSPEVVETAESIAVDVTFTAPVSATPDPEREDEAPIVLDGRVFGDGDTGVILVHMRTSDQTAWFPYATDLARDGDFTVLTFDFRGYGDSTGDKEFDRLDLDLDAAISFMRDTLEIADIYLIGASMGGTAALISASRTDVEGVVAISPLSDFRYLDALDSIDELSAPVAFFVAEDDVAAARSVEDLFGVAPNPKSLRVYEGDDHGLALFDGEHGPDLERSIARFVAEPLTYTSETGTPTPVPGEE